MLASLHDGLRHTPQQLVAWARLPVEITQVIHAFNSPRLYTAYGCILKQYVGATLRRQYIYASPIEALQQSPDGQWLGVYTRNHVCHLRHTNEPVYHRLNALNSQAVYYPLAFSSDSQFVATNGTQCSTLSIAIWHVATGQRYNQLLYTGASIWRLAFTPDDRYLVGGGSGTYNNVFLWQVQAPHRYSHLMTDGTQWANTAITTARIAGHTCVLSACLHGFLRACRVDTGALLYEQPLPAAAFDIECNHQGTQIAVLNAAATVCDAASGRILFITAHKSYQTPASTYFPTSVVAAAFSWDDVYLMTGGAYLDLWCTATGHLLWSQAFTTLIAQVYNTMNCILTVEEDVDLVRLWPCRN